MHYSCLVVGDPYLAMNPYCGNYNGWVYDENYDIYRDTNGNKIDENRIYCDYFNIGGRWDSYIGIKDKEDEPYKSTYDNMYVSEEQKKIGGGCSSAVKKNIIGFIDRKHGRTNKYPNTFAYIDDKGIHEMPEDWDYRLDNGDIDKVKFKNAKAKWRKNYIKWYKSIPDDEIITIIDYHM